MFDLQILRWAFPGKAWTGMLVLLLLWFKPQCAMTTFCIRTNKRCEEVYAKYFYLQALCTSTVAETWWFQGINRINIFHFCDAVFYRQLENIFCAENQPLCADIIKGVRVSQGHLVDRTKLELFVFKQCMMLFVLFSMDILCMGQNHVNLVVDKYIPSIDVIFIPRMGTRKFLVLFIQSYINSPAVVRGTSGSPRSNPKPKSLNEKDV